MPKTLLSCFLLVLVAGCSRTDRLAREEQRVVSECYRPFFEAARKGDIAAMKAVLSAETVRHHEEEVFTAERPLVRDWKEFLGLYEDMRVSEAVDRVRIQGERATVVDTVGGRLRCRLEGGRWKADLAPR